MSSILNSDFISIRLIVQGVSLGEKFKIGKENQKFPSGIISFPYYIQIALNLLEILYNIVKH